MKGPKSDDQTQPAGGDDSGKVEADASDDSAAKTEDGTVRALPESVWESAQS